jgi:2-polyprenyl-3-methyl-5-hydroxy-6-metoxy-1,4-benzoquinol methylase
MDVIGEKTLRIMNEAVTYNSWLFSVIRPYLKKQILEIGSGIGNFTKLLGTVGDVTATDVSKLYLRHLKVNYPNLKSGVGNIENGDFFFGAKNFDTIVCMNVLEHIKNHTKALANMNSLLKKNGNLVLLVPAHMFAYGEMDVQLGHYRRYNKESLSKYLTDAHFEIHEIRYLNPIGLIGWYVNAVIRKRKIIPEKQLQFFDLVLSPFLAIEKYVSFPFGLSVLAIASKK